MIKKIFLLIVIAFILTAYAEERYDSEDVSTDSTTYQLAKSIDLHNVNRGVILLYNQGDTDAAYQIRSYPDKGGNEYAYFGTATSAGATLVDSNNTFIIELAGETVYNTTDGSEGTITDTTSTTVTATLAGGTDNTWAVGDFYRITQPMKYYVTGSGTKATTEQAVYELENYYGRVDIFIKKPTEADSTAEFKYSYRFNISN